MSWFVSPETAHIDLADGPNGEKNWIEIKRELNTGEDTAYKSSAARYVFDDSDDEPEMGPDGKPKRKPPKLDIDMNLLPLTKVHAYLVAWSADKEVSLDAIKQLRRPVFDEIDRAISAHIAKVDLEKKASSGKPNIALPSESSSTSLA
jgi:hypothetical protein